MIEPVTKLPVFLFKQIGMSLSGIKITIFAAYFE